MTVPKHQPRLTQDSNFTDLVHLALSICPRALEERVQPFLTHSSSSALEFQLEEERLRLSLVQTSPAVSSAQLSSALCPCPLCCLHLPGPAFLCQLGSVGSAQHLHPNLGWQLLPTPGLLELLPAHLPSSWEQFLAAPLKPAR